MDCRTISLLSSFHNARNQFVETAQTSIITFLRIQTYSTLLENRSCTKIGLRYAKRRHRYVPKNYRVFEFSIMVTVCFVG